MEPEEIEEPTTEVCEADSETVGCPNLEQCKTALDDRPDGCVTAEECEADPETNGCPSEEECVEDPEVAGCPAIPQVALKTVDYVKTFLLVADNDTVCTAEQA